MRKFAAMLICLCLFAAHTIAQNRVITGTVLDEAGVPVNKASVVVKGMKIGTVTGADGTFSISVPATVKILIISSLNANTQTINIEGKSNLSVALANTNSNLQDVVVVAYGTKKKTAVTGSATQIGGEDLENKPFTSVDKALQGAAAGLQSVAGSGAPGSNQQIRIRGISSVNAGNEPLWVIDGVYANTGDLSRLTTSANALSTINPNDIESITVLKDASASALYGSRAANGVIIVTTKKGKAGVTKFRADAEAGQTGTAYKNDRYKPLNAAQYINITREGLVNAGNTQATIDATLTSLGSGNGTDFNWLDAVTRTGSQQQYNMSASGGNDKTTFYTSGGYFKQDGNTIATTLDRFSGAIRVTNKATDKLTLNVNLQGGSVRQYTPLAGGAFGNPVLSSYFILPTKSAYKPDGSYNILTNDFPTSGTYNTIALANMDKRLLKQVSLRGSVSADYKILDNLTFRSNMAIEYTTEEEDQYNNPLYGDGYTTSATTTGRAYDYYTRYMNYVWTNTLNYKLNLNKAKDVYLNALVGYESQSSKGYFTSLQNTGFPPTLLIPYAAAAATPKTASSTISDYSFISYISSLDFNYKERYVLSGSFRRDGSSRFGANHPYGNFYSVGGAWNIDKESFMQNQRLFDVLKLRGSYGVTGNASIGNYDSYPSYGYGFNYNSAPGSAPTNVGNVDLTWEKNKQFDVGLDMGILKNRINISVDYYNRKSTDLLLDVQLSRTSGFTSARRNIGSLENKGVEVTIDAYPVRTRNFSWEVNFNFANNKNTVLTLPFGNDIASPVSTSFLISQGHDVQSFYVREYAGADPANGDPLWYTDGTHGSKTNAYSSAARQFLGSASPKYFGALTNTFKYKGFGLDVQFNYNYGNYIQDAWGSYYAGAGFGATFNKVQRIMDRWQKAGDVTDMPKYIYGGNKSFNSFSTFYLNKGDFIRLRNIQLSYELPKSLTKKLKTAGGATFYVRGTNLWTWVKDKNLPFDPEQGVASQTNLNVFISKSVTAGININF